MKVLSCNIRDARADDGPNNWCYRKSFCIDVIARQAADIICFQEMREIQLRDIAQALSQYDYFGLPEEPAGRDLPNAIFYRPTDFVAVDQGGYYLSETPHVAGSKSWQSAFVRLANWLLLEEKTSGKKICITNTHLDNYSQLAREQQIQIIINNSNKLATELPQILAGDMNCDNNNKVLNIIRNNHWIDCHQEYYLHNDSRLTYHAFQGLDYSGSNLTGEKIDWLFALGNVRIANATIICDHNNGLYPSDHFFISATLAL